MGEKSKIRRNVFKTVSLFFALEMYDPVKILYVIVNWTILSIRSVYRSFNFDLGDMNKNDPVMLNAVPDDLTWIDIQWSYYDVIIQWTIFDIRSWHWSLNWVEYKVLSSFNNNNWALFEAYRGSPRPASYCGLPRRLQSIQGHDTKVHVRYRS